MIDEQELRRAAEAALDTLKRHLIVREEDDDAGFEVEEQSGVLNVSFDEPPGKFVITPNAPVRQIWISALATRFNRNGSGQENDFVLEKAGERLKPLVARLANEQLGESVVELN